MKEQVESAKEALKLEIQSERAEIHKPLTDKWGRWRIIDYVWACHKEGVVAGDCKDWLIESYKEAGMFEEERQDLIFGVELIMDAYNRMS